MSETPSRRTRRKDIGQEENLTPRSTRITRSLTSALAAAARSESPSKKEASPIKKPQEETVSGQVREIIDEYTAKTPQPRRAPAGVQISGSTVLKLIVFSILMFTLPLYTYFGTVDRVFGGETMYAAISAAVAANVVLVAYVIMAFMEDASEHSTTKRTKTE